MKFHFLFLAVVSLFSLSGCLFPDENAPPENPVLKIVTNVNCALFLDRSGIVELQIQNIGTLAYSGSALVYVDIDGDRKTSPIDEPIPVGGTVNVGIEVPSIPPGDWTGGVGIANQGPTSVSCLG